ncbi:hypothetical protein NP511_11835 [Natrinema thermotolerans]|uniref:SipW-cognate class signal peptide n=1 Tax=Natrinema thermotolerans TaxID=121872 RepID=A0AAF0P8Y4_9EURY|nr:hypothetical protein [Natrinema thermotolerans]WMT06074.1 hypothetical protein NP511_11835 [Natrinema thermotolerans]
MRMNRRNVLVGLGTIVAGGGAALGTGAFSSVEAERTVTVETAGDANAFLGLDADNAYDVGGDTVQLNLGSGENDAGGDGLNINAVTKWQPMLAIQNNGTQNVTGLSFGYEIGGDFSRVALNSVSPDTDTDEIGIEFQHRSDYTFGDSDGFEHGSSTTSNTNEPSGGNSLTSTDIAAYDLLIDTRGSNVDSSTSLDVTVTITASTQS